MCIVVKVMVHSNFDGLIFVGVILVVSNLCVDVLS